MLSLNGGLLHSWAPCLFCPHMCLPFVALGALRITVSPYGTLAWRSNRHPTSSVWDLISHRPWASCAEYNLSDYVLRPGPLQIPDHQCLPGPLFIRLGLPLHTWVIRLRISLPGRTVTILTLGTGLTPYSYPNLRLSIGHQEIRHWLEKWRNRWPNISYPQNNKLWIVGLEPSCVLHLIEKLNEHLLRTYCVPGPVYRWQMYKYVHGAGILFLLTYLSTSIILEGNNESPRREDGLYHEKVYFEP